MPCQVATIFATVFDQLARFSIEQYLLWAMNTGAKVSAGQLIPQLFILGRLVAGGVFAGFTRAQTDTFCVATSSILPIAIVVIAMDVVILLLLALGFILFVISFIVLTISRLLLRPRLKT